MRLIILDNVDGNDVHYDHRNFRAGELILCGVLYIKSGMSIV